MIASRLTFSPVDLIVVLAFLGLMLSLGLSTKLRDSSVLQYLAAGRSLSMPAFVATLVSTWYGGVLAIGDSVKAYGVGSILLLGVPYYVFALLYAWKFAGRVREAEQISLPERLHRTFGRNSALMCALLVFALAVPAAHVRMLGELVHLLFGWNLPVSLFVAAAFGTLMLFKGGLVADVRAGIVAFILMYVGFFVIVGWCLSHYPPQTAVHRLDPSLLRWDGGGGPLLFVSYFILGAWTLVDPGFHQRVASCASPAIARKGLLVCVGFWALFDLLTTTAGLYSIALLRPVPGGLDFFPLLGDRILPQGLRGLFFVGMAATLLSALVGYTLVSGATFGREAVARLKPGMSDDVVKKWMRIGLMLAALLAFAIALTVKNVVVDLWYAYSGAIVGALLIPVSCAYLPSLKLRASDGWIAASMLVSFAVGIGWMAYGRLTGNEDLNVKLLNVSFSLGTLLPVACVSALTLSIGGLLPSSPTKNARLDLR